MHSSVGRPGVDLMGRPEAEHDHHQAPSNSNEASHQAHDNDEQQSQQAEHQTSPQNPTRCQTYVLGRPSRPQNDEHQQEQGQDQHADHVSQRSSSSDAQLMQEFHGIRSHQQPRQPPPPHHHHVHYYLPPPNPHHNTNIMAVHNCHNHYAPHGHHVHQLHAMPPGLRPQPGSYYSPPPPPPHPPTPSLYQSQPMNHFAAPQHLHHSQPINTYGQQVVMYPPPAAYNYPASARNPQPYVNYNNVAATGIPMLQSIQLVPMLKAQGGRDETNWKTGLFECFLDPSNAIMTVLCPCWTFGQIAEIVDNGQTACSCNAIIYIMIGCFIFLPCILSCTYRRKLRNKLDLPESPAPDCLVHLLCEWCALCQEHRELELRGLNPSLGWVGKMEQLQRALQKRQGTMVAPPMPQRMTAY